MSSGEVTPTNGQTAVTVPNDSNEKNGDKSETVIIKQKNSVNHTTSLVEWLKLVGLENISAEASSDIQNLNRRLTILERESSSSRMFCQSTNFSQGVHKSYRAFVVRMAKDVYEFDLSLKDVGLALPRGKDKHDKVNLTCNLLDNNLMDLVSSKVGREKLAEYNKRLGLKMRVGREKSNEVLSIRRVGMVLRSMVLEKMEGGEYPAQDVFVLDGPVVRVGDMVRSFDDLMLDFNMSKEQLVAQFRKKYSKKLSLGKRKRGSVEEENIPKVARMESVEK